MKREFSFYEFVALLVPSCILIVGISLLLNFYGKITLVDFNSIGETMVFLIVCYGIGHIVQSIGNLFEKVIWWIYGGMPTKWLANGSRFGEKLFKDPLNQDIIQKLSGKYGNQDDFGRLTYNFLFQSNKCARIDIFNGNYSLFRGLAVVFLMLALMVCYYANWKWSLLSFIPFLLLTRRMIRFAKYYASETFITFYNA
jgi:hypothetical protein